jgi:nucleoside-diphosphate-sugar epimerase
MRAFIAGATGYTGRALVRVLRERGHEVVAHVRPDSPALARWREQFTSFGARTDSSPWQPDSMARALASAAPTHVFALLGTTRKRMRERRDDAGAATSYEAVDYGLSALLLRATVAASPSARFIYLSSLGASERGNAYMRARGRLERELRESGLSWIVARPSFVTGEDREESRPAERVAAAVTDAFLRTAAAVGIAGPARKYASMTGVTLARALASLAADAPDGIYEAGELRQRAGAGR